MCGRKRLEGVTTRKLMQFLTIAIATYALIVAALYVGQRRLLYLPDRTRTDPAEAGAPDMREVTIETSDGLSLLAWYRAAQNGHETLVFFHGNAGGLASRADKIRPYLDAGYGVLLPAYRGYSGNPGTPDEEGLYRDGRAALAYLTGNGVAAGDIVLHGESLGTGIAVQMAIEQPIAALILEAPFTSMPAAAQHHYFWLPAKWLVRDRYDNLGKIDRVNAPLLIVHGEADRVVPTEMGRRLYEAANEPKQVRILAGAGHVDGNDFGLADETLSFLARHLGR